MFELRWLKTDKDLPGWNGKERVLQYRTQIMVTSYSIFDEAKGDYMKFPQWTEWKDVPESDGSDSI